MNFSSTVGFLIASTVLIGAIWNATGSKAVFFNGYGLLIVLGGTLAVTMICLPIKKWFTLMKVFFQKVIGRQDDKQEYVISEVVALARGLRDDSDFLEAAVNGIHNPFLKEAVELEIKGGIKSADIDNMLQMRALTHYRRYEDEAGVFKTIGKFPPAFGLMGTTLGMIALLQGIGSSDSFKNLGPAMAIALVTTFYGVVLANMVLLPIGEALTRMSKEDEVSREIILAGLKLLRQREHPIVVEEYLKSYLLPSERENLSKKAA